MADLILKTRLDVLRSNLRRVTEVGSTEVGSVENIRADLKWLLDLPADMDLIQRLSSIYRLMSEGKQALMFYHNERQALSSLEAIEGELKGIQDYLDRAKEMASRIQSRTLALRGEGSPWNALQDGLVVKAEVQMDAISEITDDLLGPAAAADRQGDAARAIELKKSAWERYSAMVYRESSTIFCEYLDFLSGLALRDTGLDQGMCRIADRLLRDGGRLPDNFTWDSLTIPTQREALQATLAKIVRLGFPEWTIWALPLAVHEFGHVAVTIDKVKEFVSQRAGDEQARHRLEVCLADAFATHMMGPAYACAVILLRLDPCTAFAPEDDRLTEKRARVVLAMLEYMDGLGQTDAGAYSQIRSLLESEWEDALRQVGVAETLSEDEEQEIRQWVKLISQTMGKVRALPPSVWPRVTELAEILDPAQVENVKVRLDDDLRVVLNAAWKKRIDDKDLSRVDDVARAAVRLWDIKVAGETRERGDQYFRTGAESFGLPAAPVSKPGVTGPFTGGRQPWQA
jgi:hypothetical protein